MIEEPQLAGDRLQAEAVTITRARHGMWEEGLSSNGMLGCWDAERLLREKLPPEWSLLSLK
jgi:hypothetical protein